MICKMDILFGHVHINAVICVTQTFLSALSRSPSLFIFKSSNFLSYYPAIFVLSFCGIWNLDFFRYLIPSFCIKKSLTPLQSTALEYVIAIYPLLLVAITYVSVELYDRDYKLVVMLCMSLKKLMCTYQYRTSQYKEFNVKFSLLITFATFLQLSYTKLLFVSFNLLNFTYLKNSSGNTLSTCSP